MDMLERIRQSAAKKILVLPHAAKQMLRPERMISMAEVHHIVEHGELIEDYTDDVRRHSCLLLGYGGKGRPIHVVCSPKDEYLAVITVYLPRAEQWDDHFRTRRAS
jgi:hypothetical protein